VGMVLCFKLNTENNESYSILLALRMAMDMRRVPGGGRATERPWPHEKRCVMTTPTIRVLRS